MGWSLEISDFVLVLHNSDFVLVPRESQPSAVIDKPSVYLLLVNYYPLGDIRVSMVVRSHVVVVMAHGQKPLW